VVEEEKQFKFMHVGTRICSLSNVLVSYYGRTFTILLSMLLLLYDAIPARITLRLSAKSEEDELSLAESGPQLRPASSEPSPCHHPDHSLPRSPNCSTIYNCSHSFSSGAWVYNIRFIQRRMWTACRLVTTTSWHRPRSTLVVWS